MVHDYMRVHGRHTCVKIAELEAAPERNDSLDEALEEPLAYVCKPRQGMTGAQKGLKLGPCDLEQPGTDLVHDPL